MESREQIALFIDLENFAGFCLELGLPLDLSFDIKKLTEHGRIVIRKSFGDIYKIPVSDGRKQAIRAMLQNNLIQHEDVRYLNSYKNSSDIRLIIEALSVAYTNPTIDTFVVIADDRDFVPLFNKLREIGKTVIGVGSSKDATKEFYTSACDRFYYHATLSGVKAASSAGNLDEFARLYQDYNDEPQASDNNLKDEIVALLIESVKALEESGKEALGARVGPMMRNLKSDFDYREYGFHSLKDVCRYAQEKGLIDIRETGGLDFMIVCNDDAIDAALLDEADENVGNVIDTDHTELIATYRNFVVGKLKADLMSFEDRQRVYNEVVASLALHEDGITLTQLSNGICNTLSFSESFNRSAYKLLYGLYRGRAFRCGYSDHQYNPLLLELSVPVDQLDQRFIRNTLQVFSRERRNIPFNAEAWSELFYGDQQYADEMEGLYYDG